MSGVRRNDSLGHSAKYCTYTLADTRNTRNDQAILEVSVVDEREAAGKSNNMGLRGQGMDMLLTSPMIVNKIVTDGYMEIAAALMSKYIYLHQQYNNKKSPTH